ncbi:hypothetical protein [Sphingomonas sp.]|uniref:hypothetical protein n=1 Tax=Sphingomonas sp. TaxID=28214 RepID=UPI0035C80886
MSGHTPGPWAVSKKKQRRVTANGIQICNAILRNQGGPKAKTHMKDEHEAEANACLIAAAPDLLAALDALRNHLSGAPKPTTLLALLANADLAIAKARGEA